MIALTRRASDAEALHQPGFGPAHLSRLPASRSRDGGEHRWPSVYGTAPVLPPRVSNNARAHLARLPTRSPRARHAPRSGAPPPRPRRRGGPRGPRARGATGVGRGVAQYVQHRTAGAFQQATGTSQAPQVTIDGFPILSQVVAGRLNHVSITTHGIPADPADGRLPVTRLDLGLTGVRQSGDEQAARADSAKAGAFLSYDDLSSALGLGITAGDRPGYVDAGVGVDPEPTR
ncbi:DUF2993 domain-containing protein [Streptomyces roseoverticillatus]|uniref:LmeA family phospholipid-binding protein n=1 Tax=Streptomyces roseoverticillatus TaxID=66429 RepID=UPI0033C1D414